ncbi:hypothetical protein F5B22DRAFT_640177 [Xylaria bambusicola]|uniref:uncharacterized protein n=1 Tax=Xylaria bambusicola TaxID=326684 RepID=UPI002008EB3E|nr:uncharacterized protein F5B22DRAFT_640177 [Xylaria bambusicola]KAI0503391.1 hypothetical protein F5B22DRAFT_640177 [Xylaria bambusicola]
MNRRSHRKSRLGCQECKRRHIKCDEKRPTCAHCTITHRTCKYVASPAAAIEITASASAATATGPESTSHLDEAPSPGPNSNATPTAHIPPGTQTRTVVGLHGNPYGAGILSSPGLSAVVGNVVNMNHMEFLLHYKPSIAIPELDTQMDPIATTVMNKLALEFPWLLHEILAISSRHLAVVTPDKAGHYLAEASQLQTQAINLFNSERLVINERNCSAALLFSSILGRHMLVDTLSGIESDGAVLLDDYCRYVHVHRGLRAIASDAWQLLPESELWPLLLFSGIQRPRKAYGTELGDLRRWIEEESRGLDENTLKICLGAVELLQVGLDEVAAAKTHTRVHQMAFIWSVCVDAKFIDLVVKRLPQALVILAHYAALLHHSRSLWQIRDAGHRFLHTICSVLGTCYEERLLWVRNLVFGSEG